MKRSFLIIVFFLMLYSLWGQKSDQVLVYKITDEEALSLYQYYWIDSSFFHSHWKSFHIDSIEQLPLGHFLVASFDRKVNVELKSIASFGGYVVNNRRDLIFRLVDQEGDIIESAEVILNGRKIEYDSLLRAYVLEKSHKEGIIVAKYKGETAYFLLSDGKSHSLARQYLDRIGLKFAINTGKRTWYRIRRIPYKFRRSLRNGIRLRWRRKYKNLRFGYIALNKPVYRPGDTLKLKAYILDEKDKPWDDTMKLYLINHLGQKLMESTLGPESKGNYNTEIVLPDSLSIDRNYSLRFSANPYRGISHGLRRNINIQDYELDNFTFSILSKQVQTSEGDSLSVLLETKTANGQAVSGGKVKFVLTTIQVKDFFEDKVIVPDTLWQSNQVLSSAINHTINISSNVFPKAAIRARLMAYYQAPDGNIMTDHCTIRYNQKDEFLDLQLSDGYITGKLFKNGMIDTTTALLIKKTAEGDREKSVKLPFKKRVDPMVLNYTLKKGSNIEQLDMKRQLNAKEDVLQIKSDNSLDSVSINVNNPYGILYSYFIFQRNKVVKQGWNMNESRKWKSANPGNKDYRLVLHYHWGGEQIIKNIELPFYKDELQLSVHHPQRAIPNKETMIKVEVKKNNGKKAAGVDLVVGAHRSQFESKDAYQLPKIQYKKNRPALIHNSYEAYHRKGSNFDCYLDETWAKRFGIINERFYRFKYPEKGLILESDSIIGDSFYSQVAQLAPFVVDNGYSEPIHLIYLDRRIIHASCRNFFPYSFVSTEGKHSLTLRTSTHEYFIPEIELKKGHKLYLVIDQDKIRQSDLGRKGYILNKDSKLSHDELKLVRNNMMVLAGFPHDKEAFIWTDSTNIIHLPKRNMSAKNVIVGPVYKGSPIYVSYPEEFNAEVVFEPGYAHKVEKDRDRLYEDDTFKSDTLYWYNLGGYSRNWNSINDLAIPPSRIGKNIEIETDKNIPEFQLKRFLTQREGIKSFGKFWFNYEHNRDSLAGIILANSQQQGRLYKPYVRRMNHLPPGSYELFLFQKNGTYFCDTLLVKSDTLFYKNLDNVGFKRKGVENILYRFFGIGEDAYSGKISELFSKLIPVKEASPYLPHLFYGAVTDYEEGWNARGAEIVVYQNGLLVNTAYTDYNGNYQIAVPEGMIRIWASDRNGGLSSHFIDVKSDMQLNFELHRNLSVNLDEIVVVSEMDRSTSGGARRYSNSRAESKTIEYVESASDTLSSLLPYSGIRTDRRDYAYFEPALITDRKGEAYFTPSMPGTLSNWHSFAIGMDRKGRAGATFSNFQTYKPLTAQLFLPRFLLWGDTCKATGYLSNHTGENLEVKTSFSQQGQAIKSNTLLLSEGEQEHTSITSTSGDSLQLDYRIETEGYLDGEKHIIPLYPVGSYDINGYFNVIERDTTFQWKFEEPEEKVVFYAEGSVLPYLQRDLRYIKNRPFICNENNASRLSALVMEQQLQQSNEEIISATTDSILKVLSTLQKVQRPDGAWGWCPGGKANIWMTVYVLRALHQSVEDGYRLPEYERGLRFLRNELPAMSAKNQLLVLELFAEVGVNINYDEYLNPIDSSRLDITSHLRSVYIRQIIGQAWDLDIVLRYKNENLLGGCYWGGMGSHYLHDNHVQATLLAYKILESAGENEYLNKIARFFMSQHRAGGRGWRNSYETIQIIKTVFSDSLQALANTNSAVSTIEINGALYNSFPVRKHIRGGEKIHCSVNTIAPIFITAYQEQFNPIPEPSSKGFNVKTALYQKGDVLTDLQVGIPAKLIASIRIDKAADYVMIEIPIPAGCSYADTPKRRNEGEVYRQYFRHKVAIFCEHLEAGTYNFEIALEPRFSGSYTMNPARAELMYFPSFHGRNEVKKMEIK